MGRPIKLSLIILFTICVIFGGVRCGGSSSLFTTTVPTWIFAAWTVAGEPTTYRAEDAEEWNGDICHSTNISLTNHAEGSSVLRIVNSCFGAIILHICASQGNEQPNLPACAEEPSDTPYDNFAHVTIAEGGTATIETNERLSINIYYCSDEMVLGAQTPVECVGL